MHLQKFSILPMLLLQIPIPMHLQQLPDEAPPELPSHAPSAAPYPYTSRRSLPTHAPSVAPCPNQCTSSSSPLPMHLQKPPTMQLQQLSTPAPPEASYPCTNSSSLQTHHKQFYTNAPLVAPCLPSYPTVYLICYPSRSLT